MDSRQVSKLIADDLAANPAFFNSHGVDVKACLISPKKSAFDNSLRKGEVMSLWVVFEELPGKDEGYLVVFDDQRSTFGLAIHGDKRPVFLGYYGSFTETLSGM